MSKLEELDLSYNQICEVPDDVFNHLEVINLANNPLQRIPNYSNLILDSKQYLQFADVINSNQLMGLKFHLEEQHLMEAWLGEGGPLTHLQQLDLSEMDLKTLANVVCRMPKLLSLNLSRNQLSTLPSTIAKLSHLTSLCVVDNDSLSLPNFLCKKLHGLTSLFIRCSETTTPLPDAIGELRHLKSLMIHNRGMVVFSDSMGQLRHLQHLSIHGMGLSTLAESIGQLVKLKSLKITGRNQLTSLPDSIEKLVNLKRIRIDHYQ